jgi:hypothetical protein
MPIGDSSHQISVVVHQHAQLDVFPELEPLADTIEAFDKTAPVRITPVRLDADYWGARRYLDQPPDRPR